MSTYITPAYVDLIETGGAGNQTAQLQGRFIGGPALVVDQRPRMWWGVSLLCMPTTPGWESIDHYLVWMPDSDPLTDNPFADGNVVLSSGYLSPGLQLDVSFPQQILYTELCFYYGNHNGLLSRVMIAVKV